MAKYYIVDYGKDTTDLAELLIHHLREQDHHVLVALTDLNNYVAAEEIDEDSFLDMFNLANELTN
jgi:hypothetical protein